MAWVESKEKSCSRPSMAWTRTAHPSQRRAQVDQYLGVQRPQSLVHILELARGYLLKCMLKKFKAAHHHFEGSSSDTAIRTGGQSADRFQMRRINKASCSTARRYLLDMQGARVSSFQRRSRISLVSRLRCHQEEQFGTNEVKSPYASAIRAESSMGQARAGTNKGPSRVLELHRSVSLFSQLPSEGYT